MKSILIFGGTGMVGQGLLRASLADPQIERVTVLGRTTLNQTHPKLQEIVHENMFDYQDVESKLKGIDAAFFCLGTTSAGKDEAQYTRITKDLTLTAAGSLLRLNPGMSFIYVSAAGADSSEKGRIMWARVRGQTENALLKMPFKHVYMFRPGIIQPLDGIKSKTTSYRVMYSLMKPVLPALRAVFSRSITTTDILAQAMLQVARVGYRKPILTAADFQSVTRESL